ncbi:MAG: PEP-CTERM sorting domain-containing protein [Alphaproteobacteria bacterium]|jgi:hypothetical protein|nr:PEP-CTERM sorting domain-containing protein [Alphaproteobacteria bacterium]MDP6567169.1 PEP-CTERM sorting domain-containing protein [Alphaproteobacteria bacterium]MDP6813102.1 PEP-CTERM sorting domain-containing protein [Alphaproteobacteria bacterium]
MFTSTLNRLVAALVLAFGLVATAQASTVIDFSSVDNYTPTGLIERIGDVSFSYDLYTNPDGFYLNLGYASNYYGERKEFFTFDDAVLLESLDIHGNYCCINPDNIILNLYDAADSLLNSVSFAAPASFQTIVLNENNVKWVEIDFTGGGPAYGDGRTHAWWGLDNITYSEAIAAAPEPFSGALLGVGLLGLGMLRRRRA